MVHCQRARHAADPPLRQRGAEAALPAQVRQRRVAARVCAVRARCRVRPGRHAHHRRARRRRVDPQRRQELDHQPRRGTDFYVVFAKTDPKAGRSKGVSAFVVDADSEGFSVGKLEHKMGMRSSPTGQPIFENVRVPRRTCSATRAMGCGGSWHPRPLPPGRSGAGPGDRAGCHRLRQPLRLGARAVRQADRGVPGDLLQARRDADPLRRRARAALPAACQVGPRRQGRGLLQRHGQALLLRHRDVAARPRPCRCWAATGTSRSTRWNA